MTNSAVASKMEIIKSMDAAHITLQELIKDKDEIIASQKAIIDGIQKKGNQENKRQLNLDNAYKVIKEKDAEILVYKDMEKPLSECDNVRKELEIKCEALELKLISEIKVNGMLEQNLEEKEITNKNIERALTNKSKEFDAMNKQLEIYDLSYLKNRSTSTHSNDMVELIDQLELLKHSNQNLILQKTELAFNTKNELLEAKEEIIGNLKMIIEQLQKEICKQVTGDVNPILSNANVSSDQLTPGVADCIDFLKCHVNNGVILNGLLIWVWIQRRTTADNIWKSQAVAKFTSIEITASKDELWKIEGESVLGKIVKCQGTSKSITEINDICVAFNKLAENETLPMFIGTGEMILLTPLMWTRKRLITE